MTMRMVTTADGSEILEAPAAKIRELAEAWMRGGEWFGHGDDSESTVWVRGHLHSEDCTRDRLAADPDTRCYEDCESLTVAIDPPEPRCEDGDSHDWRRPLALVGGIRENPGVQGHGGGVIITDVCMHCGCERRVDTWAQDPETGEQGLESVCYAPGLHAADVAIEAVRS